MEEADGDPSSSSSGNNISSRHLQEPAPLKRKQPAGGAQGSAGPAAAEGGVSRAKKSRIVWTLEMHHRFVGALNYYQLRGIELPEPMLILHMMNVEGLTEQHVASHLQKYEMFLRRDPGARPEDILAWIWDLDAHPSEAPRAVQQTDRHRRAPPQPRPDAAGAQVPRPRGTWQLPCAQTNPGCLLPPPFPPPYQNQNNQVVVSHHAQQYAMAMAHLRSAASLVTPTGAGAPVARTRVDD